MINAQNVLIDVRDGKLTYSQAANGLFEIKAKLANLNNQLQMLNPNPENQRMLNFSIEAVENSEQALDLAVRAFDEVDADLLVRASSLIVIATDSIDDIVESVSPCG